MATPGRGRGYTGRHHLREPRPGDGELNEELEAARTLAELSPRSTDPARETKDKWETENQDKSLDHRDASGADEVVLKDLLFIDEQYTPLLVLLEQFSPGEDGIQFNRKLRHFETTVTNLCPDENRLQSAFGTFRAAALQSSVTARKLAAVGASFTRQQRQQSLRAALLNVVMQGTFSKLDILERANPIYLINAANLMGDYFAEARLCNGNKVHILAFPLLQYIKSLLASDDIRAHRSLATQLMQNGRELITVLSQELEDLSISIRLRLLTPPPVSIIWLLLSADLCLNKFLPLPNTLQQFYASHLELTSDEHYNEVSYGSWKKNEESTDPENSENMSQNLAHINLHNSDDKPKLRPILGAGAGLLRQEQSFSSIQDNYDMWTAKGGLTKRYDLNSWRQAEEEKLEEPEPVFNPTVLPPNYTTPYNQFNYQDNYTDYLQQGDGSYIQDNFNNVTDFQYEPHSEITLNTTQVSEQRAVETPVLPEKVNSEMQKSSISRPVENWRIEKNDLKEDSNRNRQRNWTRQWSKDNVNDEEFESKDKLKSSKERLSGRLNRRNSGESIDSGKTSLRRNVTEVPRNHKYWDHDDRCDKDYNS